MGFAKAAAALEQGIAPRVQDTYTNAANADAGYARGLGSNVQADINQRSDANNAFLTQMGTPAAGLHQAADVGGTAYGLQGYIPASTLQREGAAFGSAAEMLPGDTLRQGQQQASATLNDTTNIGKLHSELARIAATEPAVYSQLLNEYQGQADRQAEINLSGQRLSLDVQKARFDEYATQQRLGQSAERIRLEAQSAAQTAYNENRNYKLSLARLGIESKRAQLEALKQEISLRNGGLSSSEVSRYHAIAYGMAGQAFHSQDKNTGKPISYQEAISAITEKGVPVSIAMNALHHAGFHSGDGRGTPVPPPTGKGAGFLDGLTGILHGVGGKHGPMGSAVESALGARIVGLAHEYLGTPYVYGGESPRGFDCSGFAQYLYGKVGISIPRTTYDQWRTGRSVSKGQLEPGDLVFFKGSDARGGLPGHVGIYLGGGMMIDAPHTGASVRIERVDSFGGYQGARRYGKR